MHFMGKKRLIVAIIGFILSLATFFAGCDVVENSSTDSSNGCTSGHTPTADWVVETEPACTKNGLKVQKCAVCGEVVFEEQIPALGHDFVGGVCSRCGEEEQVTEPFTEGLEYTLNPDGASYSCTGIGTASEVRIVIAVTYKGLPVTGIGKKAFYGCNTIISIKLHIGITFIGESAFEGCSGLTSIEIPDSVTTIGDRAFFGCSGLTSVKLSVNITVIGSELFSGCTALTAIIIPERVTKIGYRAFYGCIGLTAIEIPAAVIKIDIEVFYGCRNLVSITVQFGNTVYHSKDNCVIETATKILVIGCKTSIIPEDGSVTAIGDYAFVACYGLISIKIPVGVTVIGAHAFESCIGLTNVELPSGLISIGESAFRLCTQLTTVVIPLSVTVIGNYAFAECNALISVELYNNVTVIGASAFFGCNLLVTVKFHGSADEWARISIGSDNDCLIRINITFIIDAPAESLEYTLNPDGKGYTCTGIGTVSAADISIDAEYEGLPVTAIGDEAFKNCEFLISIEIPESVTVIGNAAFMGCIGLSTIDLPNSVTSIGDKAFANCTSLIKIEITIHVTFIGKLVFEGCDNLVSLSVQPGNTVYHSKDNCIIETATKILVVGCKTSVIPNDGSVTSIGDYAFGSCSGIKSITLPDCIISIGDHAFEGCAGLTSINIPEGVTSIGDFAFTGCTVLISIRIPVTVTIIGDSAFSGCVGLTSVEINGNVTSMGGYIFKGCGKLTTIKISVGITVIAGGMFSGCTSLTTIEIPEGVTSIGENAFEGCNGLVSVKLPGTITIVSKGAFGGCDNLATIDFGGSKEDWDNISIDSDSGITDAEVKPAESSSTNGLEYTLNSDQKSYSCTGIGTATDTDIVIASEYNGLPVTEIGEEAFEGNNRLTSVTIGNNVTSISYGAFFGCSGLTSITIPDSVTSIGSYAFYGCSGLTSVTIGNSVTFIGNSAFSGCGGLENIYITDIASWCKIYGLNNLMAYISNNKKLYINNELVIDLVIPVSVTSIGSYAFYDCSGLTSITIPDSVTSIGSYAFYDCSGLTSVTIGNSVTFIDDYAFYDCSGLTSVEIGKGVTSIGDYVFYDCSGLSSIIIPDSVTSIGDSAFKRCYGLTSITIGNSVTSIGEGAFWGCSGLNGIAIPDSVTSIGISAFGRCSGLTSINIPDSVTSIGEYAFSNCSGLTTIEIPASVTKIGKYAFYGCSSLASVDFQGTAEEWSKISIDEGNECLTNAKINYLGSSAGTEGLEYTLNEDEKSYVCTGIGTATDTDIVIASEYNGLPVTSIGDFAFYECSGLTSVVIPNGVTSIGVGAFSGCSGLTSVVIPGSVISVSGYVFSGCSGLESIVVEAGNDKYHSVNNCLIETASKTLIAGCKNSFIPSDGSVTIIGENAFEFCSGLTSIIIPECVTSIGRYAFYECSGLTSITIPNSVTSIGEGAFIYCSGLTSITIPNSVTSIGWCAFSNCSGLTSITIPNSVTSIGYQAFEGCSGLTSITIPDSVTSIGEYAFEGCSGLTSITIPDSVTSIGEYAFEGCSGLTTIKIPASITKIGTYAFTRCTSLTTVNYQGTAEEWSKITIDEGNECLTNAKINYSGVSIVGTEGLEYTLNSDQKSYSCTGIGTATDTDIVIADVYNGLPVIAIGDMAFAECVSLTSVRIPDSIIYIGMVAFAETSLTSIEIPCSVTSIAPGAFAICDGITSVTVQPGNSVYHSAGNCIIETESKTVISACNASVIPDDGSVTAIAVGAFYSFTGPSSLVIPACITNIEPGAFYGCGSTETVTVKPGNSSYHSAGNCIIETASKTLVFGCDSSVIPDDGSVTSIGDYAFAVCMNLTSVVIPDSVISIGSGAFQICSGLTSITIPNSITSIGDGAFYGCNGLRIVFYTGTEEKWNLIDIGSDNDELQNADRCYNYYYSGAEYTYSFNTNGGNSVDDIISADAITLPTPVKEGYYFVGWYDNAELSGAAYNSIYYSSTNHTLYAKWLTEAEWQTGESFERAIFLTCGVTQNVVIDTAGEKVYFKFVPTETRSYTVSSQGSLSTYGEIYRSSSESLLFVKGSGGGNFSIKYIFTAGETYYIAVRLYNDSSTGTFTIKIV